MRLQAGTPRISVGTALPWWERGAVLAAVVATVVAVGWWVLSASRSPAAATDTHDARLSALGSEASRLREDVGRLRIRSSQLESDLIISRSAQDALSRQVGELTAENAKLKEDATMLRKLLADATPAGGKPTVRRRQP